MENYCQLTNFSIQIICFNVSDNYHYVGPLPALPYYDPDEMKQPLRTQLIEWHKSHKNEVILQKRLMSSAEQTFSL